jgi:PAP2 superfamily
MYWEPTFYSALYAGMGFATASAFLYWLGVFPLSGDGPVRYVRKARMLRAPFREAGIILGLYSLWGLIGAYNIANYHGAIGRGEDIWNIERRLHLPSEAWMQGPALHHPLFGKLLNQYYIYGHVNAVIILLLWLWYRHRDCYSRGRMVLILFTLLSVIVQWVPVAPPRFLNHGVVDVGRLYNQTLYHSIATGSADQLAAMPSVHEGWAILVAAVVFTSTRSRWRYAVWLHPILMMYVVVATGNHYWADGIVAAALLALVFAGLRVYDVAKARMASRAARSRTEVLQGKRPQPAGEPA